jgi:hypothetical protein
LLRDNPHGLLLARDELDGWFQGFTRHQKNGGTDRPHWLEFHGARTLLLHRITRSRGPLAVRRAACSICGTIQPTVLAHALTAEALDAGLGARFLLAMPPVLKRVWTEADVAEKLTKRYADLLTRLLSLPLADQTRRKPHTLRLDPAAKKIWVGWFNRWGELQYTAPDRWAAILAKLEGYAARLALLHHVVAHAAKEADDLCDIGAESIKAAIRLVEWFAREAERVYAVLRETEYERRLRQLLEWIEARGGETTVRAVQDNLRSRYPISTDAKADLDELVSAEQGDWVDSPSGPQGGRPSQRFRLRARKTAKPTDLHDKPASVEAGGGFCGFAGADSSGGEADPPEGDLQAADAWLADGETPESTRTPFEEEDSSGPDASGSSHRPLSESPSPQWVGRLQPLSGRQGSES